MVEVLISMTRFMSVFRSCVAFILPTILLHAHQVFATSQADVDYMSVFMDVQFEVVDNFMAKTDVSAQRIIFRNTGKQDIASGNWGIYFYHILGVVQPKPEEPQSYNYILYGVNISHIQGTLYKIVPIKTFKTLKPNDELQINFLGKLWYVSRTDIFPNWYIAAKGTTAKTIRSTVGESLSFVRNFDTPNQYKRYETDTTKDMYDPYSPQKRFELNDVRDLGYPPKQVIPTPVEMKIYERRWIDLNTKDWVVVIDADSLILDDTAQYISAELGMRVVNVAPKKRFVEFHNRSPEVRMGGKLATSPEAYVLHVEDENETVAITSTSAAGAFYAFQTLKTLMTDEGLLPVSTIRDAPRFEYRGMHLDVGRNFQTKHQVFKLLNAMAMYKMNKFHFHLTEDEGWRLEIPGLEELTELGSKRCHDETEKLCLLPQLGSGPTNQTSGSGYYTVKDYQEILQHAKNLHIEVIPEFDMPGHSLAAIKAMEKRYYKYMQKDNRKEAEQFLLSDFNDSSDSFSTQQFIRNAINPCIESTYAFVDYLIRQIIDIHKNINPLTLFNFGGDEVPKGAWSISSKCKTFLASNGHVKNVEELEGEFLRRVSKISARHGLNLAGWEDGLMDKNSNPYNLTKLDTPRVLALAWNNVWEWGVATRAYKLANEGYKVIMSHATHLYFDHPYEPDPEERGYYWAPRFINARKTFGFIPNDLYANADVTRSGTPFTKVDLCGQDGQDCVQLLKPENIAGIQGHLWSETVRTEEQMDYMIFPRLLPLAERAWHKAAWETIEDKERRERHRNNDWEDFANTLGYQELIRLESLGIQYRVPPPGAKVVNGRLVTNVEYPGLVVSHSTDGGKSWCSNNDDKVCGEVLLKTRSVSMKRSSRVVNLVHGKC